MFDATTDKLYIQKVELGSLINKSTIKEELDVDVDLDRMDDNSGDENPYKKLIVNNADRVENATVANGTMINS